MLRYFAPLLLIILLLFACSSTPEVLPGNGTGPSLLGESEKIAQARTDIAIGSPDSLRRAITDLDTSEAKESEVGRDLLFVASSVYGILYPLLEHPNVDIIPPPGTSIYSIILQSIKEGSYPQVPQEQASFITLIVPTLTIFYSTKIEIEELATEALDQAAALNPGSVLPFLVKAVLAEGNKEYEEAYLLFDAALKVAPSCYPARHGLARTGYALGKYEEAYRSVTLLKTTFPDNIELLTLSTRILYGLGRYDDADKENQETLKLAPDDTAGLLLRIQILYVLGTNDPYAKRLLARVEQEIPTDAEVLRLKARFLIKDGSLEEALTVLENAVALYPDDEEFKQTYGKLLIDTGRSDQGKIVIENTLEGDPNSVDNLEILLTQAENEENWNRAGEYVQRILELDRSPTYLRRAVSIYTAYERYVTAVGFAAMLADDAGVSTNDLLEYARILLVLERTAQVKEVLITALSKAETGRIRSLIHYRLSRVAATPEERYSSLQDSLFEDPQNIETLVGYSAHFEELADYVSARKWLGRAVELLPDDEGDELRSHLAELEEKVGE
jgi:tetratricopeptide (TPR) repeat protein